VTRGGRGLEHCFDSELIGIEVWRRAGRVEKLNLSWDTKGEKSSNCEITKSRFHVFSLVILEHCTCCKNQKQLIELDLVLKQASPDLLNLFMTWVQA